MSEDNTGSVKIELSAKLLWPILAFLLGISGGSIGGMFGHNYDIESALKDIKCPSG